MPHAEKPKRAQPSYVLNGIEMINLKKRGTVILSGGRGVGDKSKNPIETTINSIVTEDDEEEESSS